MISADMRRLETDEERGTLRDRLRPQREGDASCIAALDAGATVYASEASSPATNLAIIYRRRVVRLGRVGARTVGGDEMVADLDRGAAEGLQLSPRVVRDARRHFIVMVDENMNVRACLGVDAALANHEFDWAEDAS